MSKTTKSKKGKKKKSDESKKKKSDESAKSGSKKKPDKSTKSGSAFSGTDFWKGMAKDDKSVRSAASRKSVRLNKQSRIQKNN